MKKHPCHADLQCISVPLPLQLHSIPGTVRNHLFHFRAEPEAHRIKCSNAVFMKKYKHLKKWSSPTTLFLGGEVDLEVIRVVMNVEEAAALIKLTDAAGEEMTIL